MIRILFVLLIFCVAVAANSMETSTTYNDSVSFQWSVLSLSGILIIIAVLARVTKRPQPGYRFTAKVLTSLGVIVAVFALLTEIVSTSPDVSRMIGVVSIIVGGMAATVSVTDRKFGRIPFYTFTSLCLLLILITLNQLVPLVP